MITFISGVPGTGKTALAVSMILESKGRPFFVDYVAALETHRHGGFDIWLISQHAGLIDANVRKLIGRHIHLREGLLGRYLYEWAELGAPENRASRELA